MKRILLWTVIAGGLIGAGYRSVVFVDEAEFAIITQFGKPVSRQPAGAGLHLIWPWQSARRVDRRVQIYDPRASEFLSQERKNVTLDVFVCWRVAEPLLFVEKVGDLLAAEERLGDIVFSELADQVGRNPREALVSTEAEKHRLDSLVADVSSQCTARATEAYGIEILDVAIKRISMPSQVRESVFKRMREERFRMASQYRAEGEQQATVLRADADKERTRVLAEAYKTAEDTRGIAEAKAITVYAGAHSQDPEYFQLRRTLQAYRKILDEKTTLLLSSDSDLLKYLTQPPMPTTRPAGPGH